MVQSIILLYFFEKDHCSKSLFLGLNTKYSLKKNSVFQRNFVNFSNPKKDSIGIRQPGSIKWSINWVPTGILPASTNFRICVNMSKISLTVCKSLSRKIIYLSLKNCMFSMKKVCKFNSCTVLSKTPCVPTFLEQIRKGR